MATAAKAPAKKTSPVVWVAIVGAAAAVYLITSPSDSGSTGASTAARPKKKKSTKDGGLITEADYAAKFPPLANPAVDAFNPVVKKAVKPVVIVPPIPEGGNTPIPPSFTGGDVNWYYTGGATLNGAREAILENTSTGETVSVRPGDAFKAARVASVDVSTVVLVGPDGTAVNVPVLAYGTVAGAPKAPTNAPMAIPGGAIAGAIGAGRPNGRGGGIGVQPATGPQNATLSNGSVVGLPPAQGVAVEAQTQNQNQRGRGRGRNRNPQNFGDSNNGF